MCTAFDGLQITSLKLLESGEEFNRIGLGQLCHISLKSSGDQVFVVGLVFDLLIASLAIG
jgi:hypothetical protein